MLRKIEHIAIVVSNLDAAIAHYERLWGLKLEHREIVEDQGVDEAMLTVGDTYVQLLCPLGPDTVIGKFLERRGEGLHHIAYEVDDIETALAELKSNGARLIDAKPRTGSRGKRIAFVHPAANRGLLVELVQKV